MKILGEISNSQFLKKENGSECSSLALDKLRNITLYYSEVYSEFKVTEKLTSVNKVVGTTTDENILKKLRKH